MRLVVWYDPEQALRSGGRDNSQLPKRPIARYDGSFIKLRQRSTPPQRPAPAPPGRLRPDGQARDRPRPDRARRGWRRHAARPTAPARNTRLSLRRPQRPRADPGRREAAEIEKQVEAGKLTLADLTPRPEGQGFSGVLSLIFGTGNPQEVALAFLPATARRRDREEVGHRGTCRPAPLDFEIELRTGYTRRAARPPGAPRVADRPRGRAWATTFPRRWPRRRSPHRPPQRDACMPWPEPGGCAGTCATATSPPPARSSRNSLGHGLVFDPGDDCRRSRDLPCLERALSITSSRPCSAADRRTA